MLQAEEVAAFKHEVQALRDQNEQLRATIEVKAESERTLNQTQESLYQTIREKESDSKNMELKCEELKFKVGPWVTDIFLYYSLFFISFSKYSKICRVFRIFFMLDDLYPI